jgi:phenylacetate-CoA ligase
MVKKVKRYFDLRKKVRVLRLPRKDIEEMQLMKLKTIVEHAYATVPYYHDLFRANHFKPEDLRTLDDIKKIPLTSKQGLLSMDKRDITSSIFNRSDLEKATSSGSTGEPFSFYMDHRYVVSDNLDTLRSQIIHGFRLTDRVLSISGEREDLKWFKSPLNILFLRTARFSSFSNPQTILHFYRKFRPHILKGYITSMYAFALWLERNSIRLDHRPRVIFSSAETVHDFMREKVQRVFGSKVVDRYATVELGFAAAECASGAGYHVFEDTVLPEIIEIDGMKYFVGTNLDNFATPFIRYNTHDICESWPDDRETCSCGMTMKKIKAFLGRDNDFVKTPGGELIAPIDLIFLMRTCYPIVNRFRFVQPDIETLRLEVVLREETDGEAFHKLQERFRNMGRGLILQIHVVEDIPKDASGKIRIISSSV